MIPVPILLIQFRLRTITAEMEQQSIIREIGHTSQITPLSALDTTIDWNSPEQLLSPYGGVIFGGSGDFDFDGGRPAGDGAKQISYQLLAKLRPLLDYVFRHDILTLGICFGHQMIGAYKGATVVHDITQTKSRSHKVTVVAGAAEYPLCANVPETFFAHYGHKDSLDRVPDDATLMVTGGEECKVSALRYQKNIYTTQFHPELTRDDMRLRVAATPGYLPEGVSVDAVFSDESCSCQILRNFGQLVRDR